MKILVLGGDGFCGWPTSLHLSAAGHDVMIVDNLSRRNIDNELGVTSLTPITYVGERIAAWQRLSGRTIEFKNIDVAENYHRLLTALKDYRPQSIYRVPKTDIQRAKHPIVDAHCHGARPIERLEDGQVDGHGRRGEGRCFHRHELSRSVR